LSAAPASISGIAGVGAILLEQNDEWSVQRARYMTLETIATLSDDATVSLPAMADWNPGQAAGERNEAAGFYTTAGDTIIGTPEQARHTDGLGTFLKSPVTVEAVVETAVNLLTDGGCL
jgi:hypothetical protein